MNLPPLDVVLRTAGSIIGLVFMLAVAQAGGWRRRGDLLLLIACSVAYLICSAPTRPCCSTPWTLPLLLGAAGFPFAFWRLARVVLEDESSVPPWAWAGLGVLLLSALLVAPDYLDPPQAMRQAGAAANKLVALLFVVGALIAAWRSWDGDLIEPRRQLRWWLMAYLGCYGLLVMGGEVYLWGARPPAWLDLINAGAIAVTLLVTLLYFIQLRASAMETLFASVSTGNLVGLERADDAEPASPPSPVAAIRNDTRVLARLRELMENEKLYLSPDLSIHVLGQR